MDTWQTVFLGCLLVGGILLLLTLLVGEFGHDGGIDHSGADLGADEPGWLSLNLASVALVFFGTSGLIARSLGMTREISLVGSFAVMFVGVGLVREYVLKPLYRQQYNSMIDRESYLDQPATVSMSIRPKGFGEVLLIDKGGARVALRAITESSRTHLAGERVFVTAVHANEVVVMSNPRLLDT